MFIVKDGGGILLLTIDFWIHPSHEVLERNALWNIDHVKSKNIDPGDSV